MEMTFRVEAAWLRWAAGDSFPESQLWKTPNNSCCLRKSNNACTAHTVVCYLPTRLTVRGDFSNDVTKFPRARIIIVCLVSPGGANYVTYLWRAMAVLMASHDGRAMACRHEKVMAPPVGSHGNYHGGAEATDSSTWVFLCTCFGFSSKNVAANSG